MKKPNCCARCVYVPNERGADYIPCPSCPCHTTQTTPREEWKPEFERRFVIVESGRISGPATGKGDYTFKNLKNDAYGMMDFIRETRTAAYKEGLQAALEVVERLDVKSFDHLIKKDVVDFVQNIVSVSKEELTKAISTLLK